MKTNISIPADLYENLYNEIMNYGFDPESDEDTTCYMEIEIGKFQINLSAIFEVNVVDESFSHAFGIEEQWGLEVGELEGIDDVQMWFCDDDDEVEVTELFDENRFWNQFKRYGVVSKGVQIHYGDEVVVKGGMNYGAWTKMVYLYTDTRLGVHVCVKSLHGKYLWKKQYRYILPATTGALAIVGMSNYYHHMKA